MLEDEKWREGQEIVTFTEKYNLDIHDFDAMTSSTPYLIAENKTSSQTIF